MKERCSKNVQPFLVSDWTFPMKLSSHSNGKLLTLCHNRKRVSHFVLNISQHANECYLFWLPLSKIENYLTYRSLANSKSLFVLSSTYRVVVWHRVLAWHRSIAAFGDFFQVFYNIAVFAEFFAVLWCSELPISPSYVYHSCLLTCIYPSEHPHTFSTTQCTALGCQNLPSWNTNTKQNKNISPSWIIFYYMINDEGGAKSGIEIKGTFVIQFT